MKLIITWFCIAFIVITFSACSPSYRLIFYNNSGDTAKVQFGDNGIIHIIEDGHGVTLGNLRDTSVFIQTGTTNWVYGITNRPPREYGAPLEWGKRPTMYFQLEATGEIYILLPSEIFPLKDFSNQPIGFPLKPITESD